MLIPLRAEVEGKWCVVVTKREKVGEFGGLFAAERAGGSNRLPFIPFSFEDCPIALIAGWGKG